MISVQLLDGLFVSGCDPYGAGAAALFDKPLAAVTQAERDMIKQVFLRVMIGSIGEGAGGTIEEALGQSADLFHEIGSALSVEQLLSNTHNAILVEKLREKRRSSDQLRLLAADGFELCVRALAKRGAPNVTIHECGTSAFGEAPWGAAEATCTGTIVHDEFTVCPVHDRRGDADATCTGTLVHDEYSACPVHDQRDR